MKFIFFVVLFVVEVVSCNINLTWPSQNVSVSLNETIKATRIKRSALDSKNQKSDESKDIEEISELINDQAMKERLNEVLKDKIEKNDKQKGMDRLFTKKEMSYIAGHDEPELTYEGFTQKILKKCEQHLDEEEQDDIRDSKKTGLAKIFKRVVDRRQGDINRNRKKNESAKDLGVRENHQKVLQTWTNHHNTISGYNRKPPGGIAKNQN